MHNLGSVGAATYKQMSPADDDSNDCIFCYTCDDRPIHPILIANSLAKKYTAKINTMLLSQSVTKVLCTRPWGYQQR